MIALQTGIDQTLAQLNDAAAAPAEVEVASVAVPETSPRARP